MAAHHNPNNLRNDDAHVREAVRFGLVVAVLGVAFLVVAAVWVSTCDGATADTAWRNHETWWAWQGAGWFLLTLMLLVLTMSMPALAGPAVFGG